MYFGDFKIGDLEIFFKLNVGVFKVENVKY